MLTELVDRVHTQPFFAGMSPANAHALCEHAAPVEFPAGAEIFAEGAPADRFWLIESGTVALGLYVPGKGRLVVETIGAGTVLGWSWLHPPYRWHFGAAVREPVTAVQFDAAGVRRRCDGDPAFGFAMLSRFTPVITERLQATRLRLLDLWNAGSAGEPS